MTPYEFGSEVYGSYIPSWSLGRKFVNGVSLDKAPELSTGFMMGVYGSAFSQTAEELTRDVIHQMKPGPLKAALAGLVQETTLGDMRISAKVKNPMLGLEGSKIRRCKHLNLIDAGLDHNIPLGPLLHQSRSVDFIFVMDATQ